jgi:23S rRNA (pseudouridine1915-N3)-methyltransferase
MDDCEMKLQLAYIAPRPGTGPAQMLLQEYLRRTQPYLAVEAPVYRSEEGFSAAIAKLKARTAPVQLLLDSRGEQLSSESLAVLIEGHKEASTQILVFAIGPASGWSAGLREEARAQQRLFSLGRITLPHELARVVLAEQIYRAATILAGHPYHSGH